jgi:hypothetical protein
MLDTLVQREVLRLRLLRTANANFFCRIVLHARSNDVQSPDIVLGRERWSWSDNLEEEKATDDEHLPAMTTLG